MDAAMVKRLQEVDQQVRKLDPAVRAEAFSLFRDYILEGEGDPGKADTRSGGPAAKETAKKKGLTTGDLKSFLGKHESDKAADNVLAIAAYLYREYGTQPFAVEEIRNLGNEEGATIPERIDMTLAQSKRDTKPLFKRAGIGKFRPTVKGEDFFKKTFSVKKGTKKRPVDEAK